MIVFAEEALADLERIFEFTYARDGADALQHIAKIRNAVDHEHFADLLDLFCASPDRSPRSAPPARAGGPSP